jgi:5-(carboxyamino)imidazole ribonucleotide synthase
VEILSRRVACRPGLKALSICQDRLQEKAFLEGIGVPVAPWRAVRTEAELHAAVAEIGLPSVLKTTRLGYDGRGQAVLRQPDDLAAAWARLAPRPLILEGFVPFTLELSAIAARGADGTLAVFDATENAHRHHILDISYAPARVAPGIAAAAREHVAAVARGLDLVGLVALEMFLLPDGRLIGNEIAPRPHNSGHWTMDACIASQFEQHIRAVVGLPLGVPDRHHDAAMRNLIGPEGMAAWPGLQGQAGIAPHLYGKAEARPGRKMGHANRLLPLGALAAMDDATALGPLAAIAVQKS